MDYSFACVAPVTSPADLRFAVSLAADCAFVVGEFHSSSAPSRCSISVCSAALCVAFDTYETAVVRALHRSANGQPVVAAPTQSSVSKLRCQSLPFDLVAVVLCSVLQSKRRNEAASEAPCNVCFRYEQSSSAIRS